MHKSINRMIAYILLPVMVIIIAFSNPFPMRAVATSNAGSEKSEEDKEKEEQKKKEASAIEQSIKEKEGEIANAKKEKDVLTKGKSDIEKIKKSLENSKADLSQYVAQLDGQVEEIEANIESLNQQIADKESQIEETKEELAAAIVVRDEQYEAMKKRVQSLYEQGDNFYLELILNAKGLGDFLNQIDYIEDLSKYDDRMFKNYSETVDYVTVCEAQLEAEEEVLQTAKNTKEEEQKTIEALISQKETELASVETEIADKERAIRELEAEIAEQNATISELERLVKEQKQSLMTIRNYDGGAFCWPAPSYTKVSSEFGNRNHPVLGVNLFHNGVDLAAPGGSDILAAYDGTVVSASYTAAMGNYVMIDHGDGLYTVYMHASKLLVSQGQEVSRGQKIALVGSTGRSTGNHLHFSVRLNGEYVSPWNYIPHP